MYRALSGYRPLAGEGFYFDNRCHGMGIESEILADLYHLLSEHGVRARWKDINLLVLASRVKRDQQIEIGGVVDSPDLSLRVPEAAFHNTQPAAGERIEVDGVAYRISQVSQHPRSPILTLSLTSADE